MELAASFDAFLEDHVNLTPGRIEDLQKRVDTISAFLRHESRLGALVKDIIPQGSFAQKTIIKPPEEGDEFDADILLQLPKVKAWEPADYIAEVSAHFLATDRYKGKTDPGKRCVTIDYAGEFHIDIVPYVVAGNGDFIVNVETNKWEQTNPDGFNAWLAAKDDITDGRLIEVIRLVKYLRECSDVEFKAPSVTLTVLLGELVSEADRDANAYADLSRAFITLMRALDEYLQASETRLEIDDPTCDAQNFHDRWSEGDYATCRDAVSDLVALIDAAERARTDATQLACWRAIFGDGFKIPDDIVETESGRRSEEYLDAKYGYAYDFSAGYAAQIDARIDGSNKRFDLRRKRNAVGRHRKLNFRCVTDVPVPHEIYWKVKNTGRAAANAGQYRGEISLGASGVSKRETTSYLGWHHVEVFVVVGRTCVARAEHIVRIV